MQETLKKFKEWQQDRVKAHVVPLAIILVMGLIGGMIIPELGFFRDHSDLPWWRRQPDYWLLGLEVLLGTGSLLFFWRHYELTWSRWVWFGALMGVVGIAFWILPTQLYEWLGLQSDPEGWMKWLGIQERRDGFDGSLFEGNTSAYVLAVLTRFWRAVVLVAFAEELFWRSFLMRYLLDRDGREGRFWRVPFGKPSWLTYWVVTILFMLAHAPVDYAGAFIYGTLTYLVTVVTKNLLSVIIMHGVANLVMGCYALAFGKYGLW